jgi:hypothetical protein
MTETSWSNFITVILFRVEKCLEVLEQFFNRKVFFYQNFAVDRRDANCSTTERETLSSEKCIRMLLIMLLIGC